MANLGETEQRGRGRGQWPESDGWTSAPSMSCRDPRDSKPAVHQSNNAELELDYPRQTRHGLFRQTGQMIRSLLGFSCVEDRYRNVRV